MTDTAGRNQNQNPGNGAYREYPPNNRNAANHNRPQGRAGYQNQSRSQAQRQSRNQSQNNNQVHYGSQTVNPRGQGQNMKNSAVTVRNQYAAEQARKAREAERHRRAVEKRQEEAKRLAEETQKRAAAAAKAAARKARRAQRKLIDELKRLNTVEVKARYSFPAAIIMTALAFTVLIFAIVTTSVRISEITTENSALQRTYDSLVSEENKLRMELEIRDDLRTVENLAKNEYGMVKQDQVERYYLRTYNADKIELIEEKAAEKTSILDKISGVFGAIGGRILSFFGR